MEDSRDASVIAAAPPSASSPDGGDVPHGALRDWIYGRIRENVITGEYPQGMRLNETRLSEAFHVSRVPLRESFHTLTRDGFIDQQPRRSAVVTRWTADRVDELFDVRLGIEVAATGLAARRLSGSDAVAPLRRIVDEEQKATDEGRMLDVAEASARLHTEIVAMTGNELMSSLMSQIAQRMTWLFYLTSERDPVKACAEHHELIDAIASGNEALARSIAHAHIEKGRTPTLAVLDL
ncbi:GntR family transcriptional regulator [Demequina zhanjiangensis]|uniref:GntR family transcriptional regulator n=1 Tax=Demequina zhanjiangensis TaxID=3051659 RepID=A0ABT8FZJ2_9MICO|nr:GntR family transcriptional regulator [Demequina sp. SYSU T00b26]MDN4472242.1 GntR family transcriptional regulator [Demequina sp. SYSU T00b26]